MELPRDWSDPRLVALLDQLCATAKVNPKVQAREDSDDLRSDVHRRLMASAASLAGKPLPVWEAYLRQTFQSARDDLHARHLDAAKRSVEREVRADAFAAGHSPDSAPGLPGVLPSGYTSTSDRVVKNEELERLDAAIAQLPENQQRAIKGFLADKGPTQIAAEMGITPDAVISLLARANLKLKTAMTALGPRNDRD